MAAPLFDPGAFTARLTLERVVETPDGRGGATIAYSIVDEAWARIEPVSAARPVVTGAEPMVVTHRIWLRHRADLSSGMRLRKGGRVFVIRTFRDPDETGRYLNCACEETASAEIASGEIEP